MSCCRGYRQTAYGFVWRKMNDDFNKYPLRIDYPRNEEKTQINHLMFIRLTDCI